MLGLTWNIHATWCPPFSRALVHYSPCIVGSPRRWTPWRARGRWGWSWGRGTPRRRPPWRWPHGWTGHLVSCTILYVMTTRWPFRMVKTSRWLSSDSSGSWWAATVATYCPDRMTQLLKPKSTGGFHWQDGSARMWLFTSWFQPINQL